MIDGFIFIGFRANLVYTLFIGHYIKITVNKINNIFKMLRLFALVLVLAIYTVNVRSNKVCWRTTRGSMYSYLKDDKGKLIGFQDSREA